MPLLLAINAVQDMMSGFCSSGDLMLRKRHKYLEKNGEDVDLDRTPEGILEQIKQGKLTIQATENCTCKDQKNFSDYPEKKNFLVCLI